MPELFFKTIAQQSFTVEVEDTVTIAEVKRKIEEVKGKEFPAENQKLIFNGRVLEDTMLVSALNFTAPKFIVIMVLRKPAQAATTVQPATSASPTEPKKTTTDSQAPKAEKSAEGTASNTSVNQSKSTGSATEVPAEHTQTVANIEAMGYPRQEVIRALQAAFFDSDRAVEYLCSGIPEGLSLQPSNSDTEYAPGIDEGQPLALDNPEGLAFLAQSPQFQQLREMVRSDPTMLPQIIQQIAASNPQLMDVIRNNQDEFLQLLNAPGAEGAARDGTAAAPRREGVAIPVTPQDRQAITRLVTMGFPEPLVIEAYFACDKNEDLAVNYILGRLDEFQNEQAGAGQ